MSESTKKETEDTKDIVAILLDNVRKYSLYGIFPLVHPGVNTPIVGGVM
jgi:hypothetical protein